MSPIHTKSNRYRLNIKKNSNKENSHTLKVTKIWYQMIVVSITKKKKNNVTNHRTVTHPKHELVIESSKLPNSNTSETRAGYRI